MSEFVRRLEQTSRVKSQPLGFGVANRVKSLPLIVVAEMREINAEAIGAAVDAKADALLFNLADPVGQADTLGHAVPSGEMIPWGVRLQTCEVEGVSKLIESGCDYIVIAAETPAQILADEKLGKVIESDTSMSDGLAKSLEDIRVDALMIVDARGWAPLTVGQLMHCQRLTAFSRKPALVRLAGSCGDLEPLWDAGVRGLVVEMRGENSMALMRSVREAIEKLPGSNNRPGKAPRPLLPHVSIAREREGGQKGC
ncbi:MAG: hypothetical protein FJZ95_02250 [Chloroflexi bacterium]|nr:hypothetical protein [Chloroflexota bacterium]